MSVCIIFNPAARGAQAVKLQSRIQKMTGAFTLKPTTGPGLARQLATQAVEEGHATIVAAGGDGTLNEVLNGIIDAPEGLARARLAVLPLGTMNVFARELNLPLDLDSAWRLLSSGNETQIDVGRAEFWNQGRREIRHFLQLAGAGWDARAIERVSWKLKKRMGAAAYVLAGLRALLDAHDEITVRDGGKECAGELVLIGNGRFYGGSFPVFRKGDLRDGLLDAVVFSKMNVRTLPRHLLDFATGKIFREHGPAYLQAPEFELRGSAALQLEGELVGEIPATFRVLPRALRVVSPGLR